MNVAFQDVRITVTSAVRLRAAGVRRFADADEREGERSAPAHQIVPFGTFEQPRGDLPEIGAGRAPQCRLGKIADMIHAAYLRVRRFERRRLGSLARLLPRGVEPLEHEVVWTARNRIDLRRSSAGNPEMPHGRLRVPSRE